MCQTDSCPAIGSEYQDVLFFTEKRECIHQQSNQCLQTGQSVFESIQSMAWLLISIRQKPWIIPHNVFGVSEEWVMCKICKNTWPSSTIFYIFCLSCYFPHSINSMKSLLLECRPEHNTSTCGSQAVWLTAFLLKGVQFPVKINLGNGSQIILGFIHRGLGKCI